MRTIWTHARLFISTCGLLALWACTAHPLAEPDPRPVAETVTYLEGAPRELDMLFMIDNSRSMANKQDNLARNFPVLINELRKAAAGLPSLHLAIVSSDMGAGVSAVGTCRRGGDGGAFRYAPTGNCAGLKDPAARFIVSRDNETTRNYDGDIAEVFGCLARIGKDGCGLEEQLESIRAALTPGAVPGNAGFLRDKAFLAVILITDEDDCSVPAASTLFESVPAGVGINYLCSPAAATCGGQPLPLAPFSHPISECAARPDGGGSLVPLGEYVAFIKSLKSQPGSVLVSAITGLPQAGEQGRFEASRRDGDLDVAFTACAANGGGAPALRIKEFVEAFGGNGSLSSICADDFSPAMQRIGESVRRNIDGHCLDFPLVDDDPATAGIQPECVVSETSAAAPVPRSVARCGAGQTPCWEIWPPGDTRNTCAAGFQVNVAREQLAPAGTQDAVKCATCTRPGDPRCQSK